MRKIFLLPFVIFAFVGCVSHSPVNPMDVSTDNSIFEIDNSGVSIYQNLVLAKIDGKDSPGYSSVQLSPGIHNFEIRQWNKYEPRDFIRFPLLIEANKKYLLITALENPRIFVSALNSKITEKRLGRNSQGQWEDVATLTKKFDEERVQVAQRAKEQENAKRQHFLGLQKNMGKRGVKVCKDDVRPNSTFFGFIEDKADNRIKIVSMQRYDSFNKVSFPMNPSTTWDDQKNWYVCE